MLTYLIAAFLIQADSAAEGEVQVLEGEGRVLPGRGPLLSGSGPGVTSA